MKLVEFTPPKNKKNKKKNLIPNFIGFKNEKKFICKKIVHKGFILKKYFNYIMIEHTLINL